METGKLFGSFRPDNPRFLTLKTQVPVIATMCIACGYIELAGDAEVLKQITKTES